MLFLKILVAIWIIIIVVGILMYMFPIVEVCGDSMSPTYNDGEFLLSTRLFKRENIKVGDVFIFDHPYVEGRLLIKRVAKIKAGDYFFEGDNSDNSYDSRDFGYMRPDCLVSKVINPRKRKENPNGKIYY